MKKGREGETEKERKMERKREKKERITLYQGGDKSKKIIKRKTRN